jgi:hypothetical protein
MTLLYLDDWLYLGWSHSSAFYIDVTSCDVSIHFGRFDLGLAWSKRSNGPTQTPTDRPTPIGTVQDH